MDDVEASGRERDREVRAHSNGDAHPAPPRDRDGRPERDELGVLEPAHERAATRGELAGAVGRRQHGDPVAARAELTREPVDVLVHVVRLRPGEGSDEGDGECHRSRRV